MGEGSIRARVAVEAARLMYEEDVKQYFTAKRMAARRLFGRTGGKRMRYRPTDLPSNGEIRDALLLLAEMAEGERRVRRLFAMRACALEAMRALEPFDPRLIGSVSTGHVRRGSDIDLHVFTDDMDALIAHVTSLQWVFEMERVSIWKGGAIREYTHLHVADVFAIELTVYTRDEVRVRPRSSTDGKPIVRVKPRALEEIMAREHPAAWARYLADGTIDGLDEADDDDDETDDEDSSSAPGPFDGLLTAPDEESAMLHAELEREASEWEDPGWEPPAGWEPPDEWTRDEVP